MPSLFLHGNRLISFFIFLLIVLFLPIPGYPQGRTHFEAGRAAQNRGDFDVAIESFTLAIKAGDLSKEDLAAAYNNRGIAYGAKGDQDRAIQDYNEAIRLNPNDAVAYNNRGNAYRRDKGDSDHAIQDYDEAIRLNPNYADAYYNRGLAYGAKGDQDRAIQDLNEAIRLNPKDAGAYSGRGLTRFSIAQFQAAQEDFKKALELNATSPYYAIWLYLARARAGQDGRTELAANVERLKFVGITEQIVSLFLEKTTPDALFLAAKSSDPKKQKENLCEAQYYLGQHNLLRGNNSEARKLFSTAVETCPTSFVEYSGAQAELKRLK
jgi:lipoprotein NlpI